MKWLLVCLTTFELLGCDPQNQTKGNKKIIFDSQPHLVIHHEKDQSLLRRKLLNLVLRKHFNDKSYLREEEKIKNGDEFKLVAADFSMSAKEMQQYRVMRNKCAEIIVSFMDRIEIYFVPENISRESAVEQINIFPDSEAQFTWVNNENTLLKRSEVSFLASSTNQEVLENDSHFFKEEISLGEKFLDKKITISSLQKIKMVIESTLFDKEAVVVHEVGKRLKCTKDMQEADLCEPCDYKIKRPSGKEIAHFPKSIQDLHLNLLINGKEVMLQNFVNQELDNGKWIFFLDFSLIARDHDEISLQWKSVAFAPQVEMVTPFDYGPNCRQEKFNAVLDLTGRIVSKMTLEISGRNLHL